MERFACGKLANTKVANTILLRQVRFPDGIQIADVVAYTISWGSRLRSMTKPARTELSGYAAQVRQLRYCAVREVAGHPRFAIWSFSFITDLRPQMERDLEPGEEGLED